MRKHVKQTKLTSIFYLLRNLWGKDEKNAATGQLLLILPKKVKSGRQCGATVWLPWKFLGSSDHFLSSHSHCVRLSKHAYCKEKQDYDQCTHLSMWQADRLESIKHSSFVFFARTHVFKNTNELK